MLPGIALDCTAFLKSILMQTHIIIAAPSGNIPGWRICQVTQTVLFWCIWDSASLRNQGSAHKLQLSMADWIRVYLNSLAPYSPQKWLKKRLYLSFCKAKFFIERIGKEPKADMRWQHNFVNWKADEWAVTNLAEQEKLKSKLSMGKSQGEGTQCTLRTLQKLRNVRHQVPLMMGYRRD